MPFLLNKWFGLCATITILQGCSVFGQYNVPSTTLSPLQVSELINTIFDTDEACNCFPINKCQTYNNNTINYSGEGLIDIRIGECPSNSLDICCQKRRDTTEEPVIPPYRPTTCGFRHENGVGFRITSGNFEAQFGEFNWMIAIMKKISGSEESLKYVCGGSLIHPKVVLTAAHCVIGYAQKPDEIMLRAGEWDSKSDTETIPHQQVGAERIVTHKEFRSGTAHNDIALVFLTEAFVIAENVDVVCLAPQNENVDLQKCVASGWGKEKFDDEVYSNILKRVDLPIVPRDECQKALRETRLGPKFVLHDSFLCAGGIPGADTCKGDGGSPLMCPIPGHPDNYYQVGIVAWGIGCGTATPGVYVSIPYFRNWIDDQFADSSLGEETWYYNYKSPESGLIAKTSVNNK